MRLHLFIHFDNIISYDHRSCLCSTIHI